jgi:hypothetical protein
VINHKVLAGRHIIAGVSGGVSVQPKQLVSLIKSDDYGVMKAERSGSAPDNLKSNVWWWD